jgi:serine phosphatase RsbU (regulator of sigma subunit)
LVIDMGAVAMIVLAAARQSLVLYEQDQILVAERRLRESEQRAAEARLQVDRIKHDLSIARSIQQGLLPREHPNILNYEIAGWNQPADETGGDYYDWQDLERGRIVISLADATGHGIGPALVTSVCRAYARACMDGGREDLHDVLRRVNRLLSGDVPSGRFVTFFAAILDSSKHRLNVLSAGHGPIFYYCAAEKSLRKFDSHGLPLAVDSNAEFGPADSFDLAPGDFLAVFTDGFFEWESPRGESFGTARLADSLVHHAARPAAQMIIGVRDDLSDFVGDSPQGDDLTAVIVRRSPEH